MASIPKDLRYTETHEWVRDMGGNEYTMGLTFYAQDHMGEIVMVEFPGTGEFSRGDVLGSLEAVKTAEDYYAPFDCRVVRVNNDLEDAPALVNEDPYGKGWLLVVAAKDPSAFLKLKTAAEYAALIGE